MKRWIEYAAFLLLGALITAASIASASYVTGIPGGWRPLGIFTEPDEKLAGAGQIFTAQGDVVENRCYFVRVPGEGILYFDPHNPDTTACIHPQGAPAEVTSDAVPGRGRLIIASVTPRQAMVLAVSRHASTEVLKKAYESRYLPR